ncbi:MAG: helix-turn-helix transcriptional regulator [Bacillota bacterium]|nr:helix-turn-helix transcriptional regulator [Bacillota bacterium]
MDIITNDVYNFIYIGVIILGGITLPLTLILQLKEKDKYHKALMLFVGATFIYMMTDFVTYYLIGETVSADVKFAMITVSDIFFCALTLAWMYLIQILIGAENLIKTKYLVVFTVAYLLISQVLSISLGRYSSYSMYLVVEEGVGSVFLQWVNVIYVVIVIFFCLASALHVGRTTASPRAQWLKLMMILSLMIYMFYVAIWDYVTWFRPEEKLINIYALDPMLILYALLSAAVIFYFYKKDPLKLSGSQIATEDAIKVVVKKYALTEREADVLELINMGQGNLQIAAELGISENTVKRHVNNIFKKTDTQSRHEIIFKISNVRDIDI